VADTKKEFERVGLDTLVILQITNKKAEFTVMEKVFNQQRAVREEGGGWEVILAAASDMFLLLFLQALRLIRCV